MPAIRDFQKFHAESAKLSASLQKHRDAIAVARATLAALRTRASGVHSRETSASIAKAQTVANSRLTAARDSLIAAEKAWRDHLGRLQIDPCDCPANLPLLLLPVRIETRFAAPERGRGATLQIRVFPDTVHVDSLRRALTDAERAAGEAYWTALWPGDVGSAAWTNLKLAVGSNRAAWVAKSTRPDNAEHAPQGNPAFPDPPKPTQNSVTARLLPDRFVAVARQGGKEFRGTGNLIVGDPEMGVFLPDETEANLDTVNGIKVSATGKWIVDFPSALAVGMALTIALPNDRPIEDLYVFGVRRSLDPKASAGLLDDLLLAHRHSSGLGFVEQGTPTNNLDDQRSGWNSVGVDAAPTLTADATLGHGNAATMAAALGITGAAFAGADNADLAEDALARAANVVVWHAAYETFFDGFETFTNGVASTISERDREQLRRLHRDLVRGRGPLPSLRIGKQPYGVLPVGATTDSWVETDPFLAGVLKLLRNARTLWSSASAAVPHINPGQGAEDKTMQQLLGMSPVSLGVRAREAISSATGKLYGAVTGAIDTEQELSALLAGIMLVNDGKFASLVDPGAVLGESRPISLPYAHATDAEALAALAAAPHKKLEVKSVLQAMAQLAWSQVSGRVERNGSHETISAVAVHTAGVSAAQMRVVREVAPSASDSPAAKLFEAADQLSPLAPDNVSLTTYQPDLATRTSFTALAASSTSAAARTEFGKLALSEWFFGYGVQAELIDALTLLANEPSLERRRIAFAEALDTASHRLDAWTTALVDARCRALRAQTPDGIQIGAFGWVQDIDRYNEPESGYLHAPSMGQAVTAGILRSAWLTHNHAGDPASDDAFAIDLSSARVRDAMDLLDAVREGQGLAAALGYRVERGVHDAGLDRIILNLRKLAPLAAGQLVDAGKVLDSDVATHLAIANVVDGVALVEKAKADINAVTAAAGAKPDDNPYVDANSWKVLTNAEKKTLAAIIQSAAASLDAASDVLLAESVHHLAQGNMSRAAAAIDAAASGDSPAPVPEFVATRPTGDLCTHRLMLVVQDGDDWGSDRPRALAEPALERWAVARLGAADTISVTRAPQRTLADTGLAALDIVYGSTDPAALAMLVRNRLGLPADAALLDAADPGWPAGKRAYGDVVTAAGALRLVLASATPAQPRDLGVPDAKPPGREISAASLADAVNRASMARAALAARRDALATALHQDPVVPATLTSALLALADFGIVAPAGSTGVDIAALAVEMASQRLTRADALFAKPADIDPDVVAKIAVELFGEGFWILPQIGQVAAAPDDEWNVALAQRATLAKPAALRRWLADIGSVRAAVARYGDTLLLADALGTTPALSAVQVARRGFPVPTAWIGTSTVEHIAAAFVLESLGWNDAAKPATCLVLDHFVERLPGPDANTTAVAFNAPSPNARPPQAWLLAIAPDNKNWTTDTLLATLRDTTNLARVRGVTLERQPYAARILPVLYQQSWSLRGEDVLDFSKFALSAGLTDKSLNSMRFVKDA